MGLTAEGIENNWWDWEGNGKIGNTTWLNLGQGMGMEWKVGNRREWD